MVKEIDRREQQILGRVLVKNLREPVNARNDERNRRTLLRYLDTAPRPSTKKIVRIEKTRMGLRVYGKGTNRNKHLQIVVIRRKKKFRWVKKFCNIFWGFSVGYTSLVVGRRLEFCCSCLPPPQRPFGF